MLPSDAELPPPGPDGRVYVTTQQAADLLGVNKSTISHWRTKKYIAPIAGSPPRRPVYLWDDVLDAERTARRKAIEQVTRGFTRRQVA